ncbi:phosphotransferase family protein [Ilumatobacter coccineus]|uniref:Putative phosphotransferase n=1 Tax=Ilumatobacter coccineus (strain NBRC 103263 / KCTC 29153 / YM16-304) TaxID=1313172 RepID=A0A6C7EBI8_ILUCY|nr:phosphotransferase family protein [Ilumatobacter coccineus]BAN02569.1 putative phosphotransferase [Ilumatobacter coccineus YM16-304]
MSTGDLDDTIAEFAATLSASLDGATIDRLTRLSGGASRETWRFSADGTDLIAQRQRPGDIREMLHEAAVVRAAGDAGVPVPKLLHAERQDDGAAFMILEAIDGETIARKIQRDDEYRDARQVFARQCGSALARIHAIDHATLDGLEPVDPIAFYTDVIDELGQPHPVLELVRRWLIDHRPETSTQCLVHGDFRLGNIIVGSEGLRAVIDWELAHLGDPMEDLGWLCVKAWRFGGAPPVAGLGEYDELFDAYQAASGIEIDPDVVRWWEVLGTWKWGIMCISQASAHLNGAVRSHELAAIGRRVCENEHDLFLALEGRW